MVSYWQNWRQQEGGDDQASLKQGNEHFEGRDPIFHIFGCKFAVFENKFKIFMRD